MKIEIHAGSSEADGADALNLHTSICDLHPSGIMEFGGFLVPHKMEKADLEKLRDTINAYAPQIAIRHREELMDKLKKLPEDLKRDFSVITGLFTDLNYGVNVYSHRIDFEEGETSAASEAYHAQREEMIVCNRQLKNALIFGRDEQYIDAVTEAVVEAFDVMYRYAENLFDAESEDLAGIMSEVGMTLQALYRRDNPIPGLQNLSRPPTGPHRG